MTTQVIDRKKRIEDFIIALNVIANTTGLTAGQIHTKFSRECTNEKRFLGQGCTKEQGKRGAGQVRYKIASTTYKSYLTDYRNAILALNQENLLLKGRVKTIKKTYPNADLSGLDASLPELRDNHRELMKQYRDTDQGLYKKLHGLRIEHHAYYCMRPSVDVLNRVKAQSSENLIDKHTHQKILPANLVTHVLSELKHSNHWVDLTIYIALASGRRSIEVLKIGNFKKSGVSSVEFSGQAKVKAREGVESFDIPTITKTSEFFKILEVLRTKLESLSFSDKKFEFLTNDEINGAVAGRLNRAVKKIFGDNYTFKDLRAMYAKFVSIKHHDPKAESLAVFYSKILGHSEKDIATQLSYQGIVLDANSSDLPAITFTTDENKHVLKGSFSLEHFQGFDSLVSEKGGKAVGRVHAFVKETLKQVPDSVITQTFLAKCKAQGGSGCSRPAIKKYLELVGLSPTVTTK